MPHKFNPHMLVMGRHIRGMTQVELATAAKLQQGTISKLENGEMPASAEIVDKLSVALYYPVAFFYQVYTPKAKELWAVRCKHGGR